MYPSNSVDTCDKSSFSSFNILENSALSSRPSSSSETLTNKLSSASIISPILSYSEIFSNFKASFPIRISFSGASIISPALVFIRITLPLVSVVIIPSIILSIMVASLLRSVSVTSCSSLILFEIWLKTLAKSPISSFVFIPTTVP